MGPAMAQNQRKWTKMSVGMPASGWWGRRLPDYRPADQLMEAFLRV